MASGWPGGNDPKRRHDWAVAEGFTDPGSLSSVEANNLVRRVAQQDRNAFATVVSEYGSFVYSRALKLTQNPQAAEDVAQVVFSNLWTKAAQFDAQRGNLFAWLTILTRNASIDHLRVEGRHARIATSMKQQLAAVSPTVGKEMERKERQSEVRAALDQLGESQRKAIELAYFEGLTYVEVAERLGEPEGTVKSRIRRGLQQLARLVGEIDGI